jgi:hypothetical protein
MAVFQAVAVPVLHPVRVDAWVILAVMMVYLARVLAVSVRGVIYAVWR